MGGRVSVGDGQENDGHISVGLWDRRLLIWKKTPWDILLYSIPPKRLLPGRLKAQMLRPK